MYKTVILPVIHNDPHDVNHVNGVYTVVSIMA
jgi:hypothetical protein